MDSLTLYKESLGTVPVLTRERERELIVLAQSGDKAACDELVRSQAAFVMALANEIKTTVPREDIVQAGNLGLMLAIRSIDPSRDTRLLTYCESCVRRRMVRAAWNEDATIHRPVQWFYKAQRERMRARLNRWQLMALSAQAISLSLFDAETGNEPELDTSEATEHAEQVEWLDSQIRRLEPREQQVISARRQGDSMKQIGARIGIGKNRVAEIARSVIRRLRDLALEPV